MLFNSVEFLLFLPIVFLLYWFVFNRSVRLQNIFIVVVSYIFYGWWDWRFLLLIAFTSACSYFCGILIEKAQNTPPLTNYAKIYTAANIIVNLVVLGVFKYYNFFVGSFAQVFGAESDSLLLNVILPVGISFYTFQALSYSIDVYRGTLKPTRDIIQLFAYVSFFPQLVAGPIERATNLLPQFEKERRFDYATAVDGCRQMLWGFFKKMIIADLCAEGVNNIFSSYTEVGSGTLVVGAILFSLQIYGDFSGYSDIAIGCSKLFGIRLMRNFNLPYFSRDIAEFWRRWHISLTTWFRDYIYIPLGGSRGSRYVAVRNTFIIFLVSGFWHGANWTYVAWGAYHAVLFLPLLMFGINRNNRGVIAENRLLPSIKEVGQMIFTFALAAIGWVIFRADSIKEAADYIARMFTQPWSKGAHISAYFPLSSIRIMAYMVPLLIVVEWVSRGKSHPFDFSGVSILRYRILRWVIYYALILFIVYNRGTVNTFIYFQF
ncbi:MAG: MBOAT family O-acyltransferase [Rikenellaceae bacterium]